MNYLDRVCTIISPICETWLTSLEQYRSCEAGWYNPRPEVSWRAVPGMHRSPRFLIKFVNKLTDIG